MKFEIRDLENPNVPSYIYIPAILDFGRHWSLSVYTEHAKFVVSSGNGSDLYTEHTNKPTIFLFYIHKHTPKK